MGTTWKSSLPQPTKLGTLPSHPRGDSVLTNASTRGKVDGASRVAITKAQRKDRPDSLLQTLVEEIRNHPADLRPARIRLAPDGRETMACVGHHDERGCDPCRLHFHKQVFRVAQWHNRIFVSMHHQERRIVPRYVCH